MDHTKTIHLIIVCCHAIYNPTQESTLSIIPSFTTAVKSPLPTSPSQSSPESDSNWLLAPFQTDEPPTFITHARAGLSLLAAARDTALLVFSGSKTRKEVERSEARSYLELCEGEGFWGLLGPTSESGVEDGNGDEQDRGASERPKEGTAWRDRVLIEEQALDSLGNVLFSLLLFWKTTGQWPEKITIVSHEFKRPRFLDLHIPALRFPHAKVEYLGIDPEYMVPGSASFDADRAEDVRKGEKERGYSAWESDRWGKGEVLRGKRAVRNCWQVGQEWFGSEEERQRSAVKSEILEWINGRGEILREEVLGAGMQPWEI